jgi:hypothetical protein
MAQSDSDLTTRRSRRFARTAGICVDAIAIGLFPAHPIAGASRNSAPWVLPVLVVGVLAALLPIVIGGSTVFAQGVVH